MQSLLSELFSWLACRFRGRAELELEVIALRHQLAVLRRQRSGRTQLFAIDRLIWARIYLAHQTRCARLARARCVVSLARRIHLGRPDPIRSDVWQIASLLPEKYWFMLTLYGDESGTHDAKGLLPGSDVCGVFAYGAMERDWKKFTPMWKGRLRGKVPLFHMRTFMREKSYPYRKWSADDRKKFIESLIKVARDKTRVGFGALLYVPDYDQFVPADLKQERGGHPYYFAFQLFFDMLLPKLEKFDPPLPKGQQVAFLFEQNQFQGLAAKAFWEIKKIRDKNNRLGSINFFSKDKCVPFQAADMTGWLFREDLSRQKKGLPRREWVDQLIERQNAIVGYYDRQNLAIHVAEIRRTRRAIAALTGKVKP
jgi:hypothetical protein